ncbi:hypothetical protein E0Z10_g6309 [Xylaria hypoxylon]|uniref:Uncharacterized protein n=1 Tax=Xylaria hypoxylon TaxID=37992 RepID=A0A4Z0YGF5_9PEZI|nr:hypothetical protein E0Z10_g6309 [Xylaria hypoxylon]
MLLRQLHRPLLRSVTATWRPATSSPAPFHHGDSRSSSSSSSSGQQQEDDQHGVPPRTPTKQQPSLFEQLFPDEAKRSQVMPKSASESGALRNSWASRLFDDEPPRLAVPEELQDEDEDVLAQIAPEFYVPALRAKSMLILSAASKNLLESDFLRLGVKGKHVEGWVGGILKVIQARDPDTLEPKGHYFILFDTHEAAVAYKDRLEQLWRLGKTYVPGAHHARSHMLQQPLPRGLRRTEQGEDVADLIRSFTLVPPSQRYHVQLSRMSPAKIAELYLEGGFVNQLAAHAGAESLVMVRLDGGRLTLDTLRRAIEDDGVRRNLAWRITDLDNGILPFGKSILKAKDQVGVDTKGAFVNEGSAQGLKDEDSHYHSGASGNGSGDSMVTAIYEAEESNERHRQYPRFIIPFMDTAEAHRFVQNWHRRELKLRMGGGRKNEPSWEESRKINATVLW